jgi:hypothetical protein
VNAYILDLNSAINVIPNLKLDLKLFLFFYHKVFGSVEYLPRGSDYRRGSDWSPDLLASLITSTIYSHHRLLTN